MDTIQAFLDYLRLERNYSAHTITAYGNDIQSFSKYVLAEFKEQDITTAEYPYIRNWIVELVNSGISNRSINRKMSSLRSYYAFLQKTGIRDSTPLAKHKALKTEKKIQVPFSTSEIKSVLGDFNPETLEEFRDKAIIELFYSTGMRRSELVNLKIDDVDFSNRQVKVLGKRNKERILPLLDTAINSVTQYLEFRHEVSIDSSQFLFVTSKGVQVYDTLVYRIIRTYFDRVSTKVKKSPHILRHSFATHILNEGASLNAVKDLLGHSSLATTQIYTHNDVEKLKKAYGSAHPRNSK